MNAEQFTLDVKSIDWHSFDDSPYYNPEQVPSALVSLFLADEESKDGIDTSENFSDMNIDLLLNAEIASNVLFAIGNNHRGTYYNAAQKALPFIVQVALYGNHEVARNCAMNILIDLYYFCSDNGSVELERYVKSTIEKTILDNRNSFIKFALDFKRNELLIESLRSIVEENERTSRDV